jgi:hypothetical protein
MGTSIGGMISGASSELAAQLGSNDPALKTCQPAEAAIRNKLAFTDLYISFPTTQKASGRVGMDTERLRLPAYITEFKDNYAPNFGETQVFGRADPIPVYSNTKRQVSVGVMIPCYDVMDSNENMKKVNKLIKNLYPGYEKLKSGAKVLSSPPLIRIKFANLIMNHKNPAKGLLGYVTSFSTDFNLKGGVFLASPGGKGMAGQEGMILPRAIGISITFTALHESTIGFKTNSGVNQFFGNENFPYNTKTQAAEGFLSKQAGMGSYSEFNAAAVAEIVGWEG